MSVIWTEPTCKNSPMKVFTLRRRVDPRYGKSMVVETESIDNGTIAIYALDRPGQPIQSLSHHVPKEADHKDPIFAFPNFMPDGKSILFIAAATENSLERIRL